MLGCLDAGNGCLDALSEKKQKRILGSYAPSLVACLTFKFEHETFKARKKMSDGGAPCKSSWLVSVQASLPLQGCLPLRKS